MAKKKVKVRRPIKVKKKNVNKKKLIDQLGGEDKIKISVSRDDQSYIIKEAEIDEDLINSDNSIDDLVNDIIEAHDADQADVDDDKMKRVNVERSLTNEAIYAATKSFFGTSDREAAMARSVVWLTKAMFPEKYVDKGIRVIFTSASFTTAGIPLTVMQDSPNEAEIDVEATRLNIALHFSELIDSVVVPFDVTMESELLQYGMKKATIEAE